MRPRILGLKPTVLLMSMIFNGLIPVPLLATPTPIPAHKAVPEMKTEGTYVPSARLSSARTEAPIFPIPAANQVHDFKPQDLNCDLVEPLATSPSGRSQVYRCSNQVKNAFGKSESKEFFVFKSKGTSAEIAYDHGYMFAGHVEEGVVDETLSIVNGLTDKGLIASAAPITARSVVMCVANKMFQSTSDEFQTLSNRFIDGYLATPRLGRVPKYSRDDLRLAAVGIELDNVLSSFENPTSPSAVQVFLGECSAELGIGLVGDVITSPFRLFFGSIFGRPSNKFGCTAFSFPGVRSTSSKLGDVMHGRNLDAELTTTIGRAPVLFFHEEEQVVEARSGRDRPEIRRPFLKYVAAGSAGLMYPGGISGFNEKGISVSSHQMYPVAPKIEALGEQPEIAPMVQQHILREADSIDKAIEVAKRTQHFAGWAFLVTDAKTREAATIEVSPAGVAVLRRAPGEAHTQTNHFRTEIADSIFFPNVNKRTESENRLRIVTEDVQSWFKKDMSSGKDVQIGLNQLASHDSGELPLKRRTVSWADGSAVKPYGVLSTLAIPTRNEFWMTTVDTLPAAHSTYLGFKIDWQNSRVSRVPGGAKRATRYTDDRQFLASLQLYVSARNQYRNGNTAEALRFFTDAGGIRERMTMTKAKSDVPMMYIEARLHQELAQEATSEQMESRLSHFRLAEDLFARLLEMPRIAMSPYQRALVLKYSVINLQMFSRVTFVNTQTVTERASEALAIFNSSQASRPHFETELNIDELENLIAGSKVIKAGSIDFVIIR